MRMNYPDFLSPKFRALEWYGAEMKHLHGPGTRRCIKFEDEAMNLCIDVKLPYEEEWLRIRPAASKEYKAKKENSTAEKARKILEIPPSTGMRSFATGGNRQPITSGSGTTPR